MWDWANLSTEFLGGFFEDANERREIAGRFADEEKSIVLDVPTENFLRRLLSEFDHQREPVGGDEPGERCIVNVSAQVGATFIVLHAQEANKPVF